MKRLLSVQDLSCVGKCSLTVSLPILSSMGIEACPLPTAVLSSHTAFSHFTFRDLTDEMEPIASAWEQEGITFDTILSGYLGSVKQIEVVRSLYKKVGRKDVHTLRIVDPAMADAGKLYTGFSGEFVEAMKGLCAEADVIVPNLTEGCLLTGRKYREEKDPLFWKKVLLDLSALGCPNVILTGFGTDTGIGTISYEKDSGAFYTCLNTRLPVSYHGTGDIFASVIGGALTLGWSFEEAQKLAVDFTLLCMKKTMENQSVSSLGVCFEEALGMLFQRIRDKEA